MHFMIQNLKLIYKEYKNLEIMKITEETKIKDLIPDDMELDKINDSFYKELGDARTKHLLRIDISLNSKPEKDFEWYIKEYESKLNNNAFFNTILSQLTFSELMLVEYKGMPFEFKIGLLKFIYDDLKLKPSFFQITFDLENFFLDRAYVINSETMKIFNICPKDFLTSIFK